MNACTPDFDVFLLQFLKRNMDNLGIFKSGSHEYYVAATNKFVEVETPTGATGGCCGQLSF